MNVFSLKNLVNTFETSAMLSVRFFLFAGAIFLFFYVWKKRKYWNLKIQQKFPDKKFVIREIQYSFYTVFIFGIVVLAIEWASNHHFTLLYRPINKYGYPYYFISILLMILVHDTYFYWTHRLLHWKPLYKTVHKVHHYSTNPTPFSSYAFHPVEALVEIGILPLIVFTIPYHVTALYFFTGYTLLLNVFGHMGYEFFPKGFASHKIFKWHNTATSHNMHHRFIKCNFGLYFNVWDRVMKTNHAKYEEIFDEVIAQRELGKNALSDSSAPVVTRHVNDNTKKELGFSPVNVHTADPV